MNVLKEKENIITYTVNKAYDSDLYISIQNGEVVINAPWYATNTQIQKIVSTRKQWILSKLKEYEERTRIKFTQIKLFGENYQISVTYKNIKIPSLKIEKQIIKIERPNKYKKIGYQEITKMLVDKMYQMVAEREIENIMEKIRVMLDFAPEDYEINVMERNLAKCIEQKKIIFNPKIVKYSKETIEYIVLHEFCHLRYKKHTTSFYQMIEKYMPNYEKYTKEIGNLQY